MRERETERERVSGGPDEWREAPAAESSRWERGTYERRVALRPAVARASLSAGAGYITRIEGRRRSSRNRAKAAHVSTHPAAGFYQALGARPGPDSAQVPPRRRACGGPGARPDGDPPTSHPPTRSPVYMGRPWQTRGAGLGSSRERVSVGTANQT